MGPSARQVAVGATVIALIATFAPATPGAAAPGRPGALPLPGDWEGVGSHGLPLSFSLARRQGRLVATSVALGAPLSCPADERDAEAVPLSNLSYTGPDSAAGGSPAVLSGQLAPNDNASLTGDFTSSHSGVFSLQVMSDVGCGWPSGTLSWRVHRARRLGIADHSWAAALSGSGIVAGRVEVKVAALGRVVQSFRSSFTCRNAGSQMTNRIAVAPAYAFIRPDGRFYSPLHGDTAKRHAAIWAGRFAAKGGLSGTLTVYGACRRRVVKASFHGS